MKKGRLIIFEGTDGSGKATQTAMLCAWLDGQGIPYKRLEFPRYEEESSALVRLYLSGAFGAHPDDVNAYAASTFFAVDRYASFRQDWGRFYDSGGLVISDRYTTSNAVHQTSKLPEDQREAFLDWLFHFEYTLMGLPEPTRVIYLDMPTELTGEMLLQRQQATSTQGDIHEKDEQYLRHCRESGRFCMEHCGWTKVDCTRSGVIRSKEEIHGEVMEKLSDLLRKE